jgi:hypothetical protein
VDSLDTLNSFKGQEAAVAEKGGFVKETTRLDWQNFDLAHGLRAAVLVVSPLVLGFAVGQPQWVLATLGALLITNTEGPNSARLPLPALLLACVTEPIAFAAGTLVGLNEFLAVPLVGIGVSVCLMASSDQEYVLVGRLTAIFFAVGVGLPGGSVPGAFQRLWLSMLGGLLAFAGAWLHRSLTKSSPQPSHIPKRPKLHDFTFANAWFRDAVVIAVASSLGLLLGLALGLPRDFWIVVTIISAGRTKFGPTLSSASMIVVGTIAGALVAAARTLSISDVYVLEAFLLVFGTAMFATRGVNLGLTQVLLTPFIIILLNLLYPGEWWLALFRVLDVTVGGAIVIATVYLLSIRSTRRGLRERGGAAGNGAPSR